MPATAKSTTGLVGQRMSKIKWEPWNASLNGEVYAGIVDYKKKYFIDIREPGVDVDVFRDGRWVFNGEGLPEFTTLEEAKQWCEMVEATGVYE